MQLNALAVNRLRIGEHYWLILLGGWIVLYAPVYWGLANGLWRYDEHAHEPLIFLISCWLLWRQRRSIIKAERKPGWLLGGALLAIGLLIYLFGRATGVWLLAVISQISLLAAILLLMSGGAALKAAWFPLVYLVFMIPLPGSLVADLTGQLKQLVSAITESLLYSAGYPIGRTGAVLTVGQYQLLIADACSGLYSIFSLVAGGTLFTYLMNRRRLPHIAIMLASMVPIAFCANVIRVGLLVLITYHFGDAAGQGFLHEFAGAIMFLIGALLLIGLDAWLAIVFPEGSRQPVSPA